MVKQEYTLELQLKNTGKEETKIILTQGDSKAILFHIYIKDGIEDIDYATAGTAKIVFNKPDKTTVQGEPVKAAKGYTYELGSNEIAAIGEALCTILIYGTTGERLTTTSFTFQVVADKITGAVQQSTTQVETLTRLIAEVEALKSQGGGGGSGFTILPKFRIKTVSAAKSYLSTDYTPQSGDVLLLTFWQFGNDVYKDFYFDIICTVSTIPSYIDQSQSDSTIYEFTDLTGTKRKIEVSVDLITNHIQCSSNAQDLWLVRAGYMPSFGEIPSVI